jgi:hypothetical protein
MLDVLENSTLAEYIRNSGLLYPAIEIIHILGFTILVGAAFMFDLKLLGFSKKVQVNDLAKHLLPWSQGSFFVVLPSGFLLFMASATDLSRNPVFIIKLILICAALTNAGVYHLYSKKLIKDKQIRSLLPKINALVSILLWIGVISCGRLLAYF